jgi:hypothetical protein
MIKFFIPRTTKAHQWQIPDWDYIFLDSTTSGPTLGTNQPHIRWIAERRGISPGDKATGT